MSTGKGSRKGQPVMYKSLLTMMFTIVAFLAGQVTCFATNVALQWSPDTDTSVVGYKVYYQADSSTQPFTGTGATNGASPINVSNLTSATISGLDPSHAYYFAITAYNAAGVESSYSNIASIPETQPPTVSITSPTSGASVSGTVSVTASASDNVGVTKVEFYVNGALMATDTTTPYVYSWNTAGLAAGTYTLMAKAYDAAGNVGQSSNVSVTVVNDTTPPTVSLTAPANGATVSGTTAIAASAADNVGVTKVEFYENGILLNATNVAPYSYSWNTTTVANGSYTLTAKAYDNAGNVGQSANIAVTVSNTSTSTTSAPGTYTAVFGNASGSNYPNTVQDTFLNLNTDVNAASTTLNTYTWPANTPSNTVLMQWDLSALPAGAQIQSATLSLYMTAGGGDALYAVPVSEVINKTPVIAKSNGYTYDGVNAWDPSSIPYNGIPLAESDIAPAVDTPQIDTTLGYKSWNVTGIVQDWVANPANNRGLLLNSSSSATSDSYRTFASSEATDSTQRPKLVVTYTLSSTSTDTTPPTVTGFTVPATATTLTVPISSFTATDNVGVTGCLINESATTPSATAGGWSATPPASYAFATSGSKTLYAWAKDAAGNVSASVSAAVTITLPDTTPPTVAITSPAAGSKVRGNVTINASASDNVGVTKITLYIDNVLKTTTSSSSLAWSWSTNSYAKGSHVITVQAFDAANNIGTTSITVSK